MEVKLSMGEEEVGMHNPIKVEIKKDEGGASKEMLEDEMDSLKEEETRRSRRERMDNALAAARTAERQDPAEMREALERLGDTIDGSDVEELISVIESLADRTDLFAILNAQGRWNNSLLHCAAAAGKDDILRLLLDYAGDHLIAAQDDWGNTPLHLVARFGGSSRAAEMLIRRARELPNVEDKNLLRMKNKRGNTALHNAVDWGNVNLVRYFLSEDFEPVYWKNATQRSPLYIAFQSDHSAVQEVLLSLSLEPSRIEGLPPIHGAIIHSNSSLLAKKILEKNVKLFEMTDSRGGNVFHFAAYKNWPQVFKLLEPKTEYLARQWDKNGHLPIHIASQMGYVDLIEKLLPVSQFLNGRGQTVLHVAAQYGRASVVRHILGHPKLGKQINFYDHAGHTALHLAAVYSQPAALISLLQDKRIHLTSANNKCLTALDIARECMATGYTIRKQLALLALVVSCWGKVPIVSGDLLILRPEARYKEYPQLVRSRKAMPDWDLVKDYINSRMVVATLVATVTFAAGFAVPGGFNGSDTASKDDRGMATMLDKRLFQAFAICNTIAMFCSMTAVVTLIWARITDVNIAITAFEHTTLPLKVALPAMSTAFLTGVTLTVGKVPWLANTIFYLGLIFLLIISSAKLLEKPPFFMIRGRAICHLTFWLILAYIHLWRIETYIYEDAEDDRTASETSASQPADGAGESKPDDSAAAKCGDTPHPPSH